MTTLTPASAGTGTGMAPDPASTQQTLTDSTNANTVITAYAHALQNAQIAQLADQGDWYATFNANLLTAQQHAQRWVESLGPQVFKTVPQAIINYSDTFTPATSDILAILAKIQGVPTQAQQQQINQLVDALLTVLTQEQTTLQQVQAQLQTFATDVQGDHASLVDGENSAQAEVLIDQTQLAVIQAQINQINAKIKSDSQKALESEIGLGVAIFITIAAIAVAVATDGAAAPLVVAGIGVVGVGGAIAGTVIFSQDVKQDYADLQVQMQALSDEQKQVATLQGITTSIEALVTANEAATQAISSVLDTWAVLGTKLQSVLADLQAAEAADVPAIIESLDLQSAQTAWGQLVTFATGMEQSAETIQVNTVALAPPQQQQARRVSPSPFTPGDPGLLAPDPSSTQDQMSAQVNAAQAVTRYAQAVQTLVPPYEAAVTDPALRDTLEAVRQDVAAWTGGLCAASVQIVPALFEGFDAAYQAAQARMLDDAQRLAADPADAAAQADLVQQLQQLLDALQPLGARAAALQAELVAFQATVQADHACIENALQALENTVPGSGVVIRDAQAALDVDFVSSRQLSPCTAIVEIDSQVAMDLTAVAGAAPQVIPVVLSEALLDALGGQNETASQALSGLLDTWQVVTGKYQAAVQDLRNAQAGQIGSILQELALQAGGQAWQQLARFAAGIARSTQPTRTAQSGRTAESTPSIQLTAGDGMLNITLKSTYQDATGFNWDYYGDDGDPATFYILPRPGFVTDDAGRPSFQIVRYQTDGSDNGSGYCRMDVQLTVPAEVKQAIQEQIQQRSPGITPVFTTLNLNPGGSATLLFASGGKTIPFTVPASSFGSNVASFVLQLTKEELNTLEAAFTASGGAYEVEYHLSVPARLPAVTAVLSFDSSIAYQYQVTQPTFDDWGDETSPGSVQQLLQESASSTTTIDWGEANPSPELRQAVADWANATLADLVQAEVEKVTQLQGLQSGESFSINEVSSFTATYAENQVIDWIVSPSATLPTFADMGISIQPFESTVNEQQQVMTVSAHLPFSGDSSASGNGITAGGHTVLVDSVTVTVSYPTLPQANASHTFQANGSVTFAAPLDPTQGPAWELSYTATYHGNIAPPVSGKVTGLDQGAYTLQLPDVGLLTVKFDATQAFATQGTKPTEVDVAVTFPNSDGHGNPFQEPLKLTSKAQSGRITSIMALPVNAGYNWQATYVFPGSTTVTGPLQQGATGRSQIIPAAAAMHKTGLIVFFPASSQDPILEVDVSMWYEGTPQSIPGAPGSLPTRESPAVFTLVPQPVSGGFFANDVFTGLINGDQPLVYSATVSAESGQVVIDEQPVENDQPSIQLTPTQRYFTLQVTPAAIDWPIAKFTSVEVQVTFTVDGVAQPQRTPTWNRGEVTPKYITVGYQTGQKVSYEWQATYIVPSLGPLATTPATATDAILNIPAQPPVGAVMGVAFRSVAPSGSRALAAA